MLFTEPCCKLLKHCLQFGDNRAFHRTAENTGPLMIQTMSSLYPSPSGGHERQFIDQAVIFCPFCGTQLQTAEAVERYFKGEQ